MADEEVCGSVEAWQSTSPGGKFKHAAGEACGGAQGMATSTLSKVWVPSRSHGCELWLVQEQQSWMIRENTLLVGPVGAEGAW